MGSMSFENQPYFNMIAAYSVPDRVLGDSQNPNGMSWGRNLKKDLQHFAALTAKNTLIIGANTLPFVERLHNPTGATRMRRNVVVIGHDIDTPCIVEPTLDEALMLVRSDPLRFGEPFIAGGARTYTEALRNIRNELKEDLGAYALFYATEIHSHYTGDVYMPELGDGWVEMQRLPQVPDVPDGPSYDFVTYRFN